MTLQQLTLATGLELDSKSIMKGWVYIKDGDARYLLGQPKEKNILIFGVNPSNATPAKLDPTMNRIRDILENSDYKNCGWLMMNIFPQIEPHPEYLTEDAKLVGTLDGKNVEVIKFVCDNYEIAKIWCAWGNLIDVRPYLRDSLKKIYAVLKDKNYNYVCYGYNVPSKNILTKKGNPRHPLLRCTSLKDTEFDDFNLANYV